MNFLRPPRFAAVPTPPPDDDADRQLLTGAIWGALRPRGSDSVAQRIRNLARRGLLERVDFGRFEITDAGWRALKGGG
jgi:repressor of nif and glnA expression